MTILIDFSNNSIQFHVNRMMIEITNYLLENHVNWLPYHQLICQKCTYKMSNIRQFIRIIWVLCEANEKSFSLNKFIAYIWSTTFGKIDMRSLTSLLLLLVLFKNRFLKILETTTEAFKSWNKLITILTANYHFANM